MTRNPATDVGILRIVISALDSGVYEVGDADKWDDRHESQEQWLVTAMVLIG